ncbi:M20/M25/M40 family metallo-hydrolase [Candidatus Woesearchaeota archaeon]|nr:M20/M25/M40 family metallo-hydrolase [Candidatus Woesearchaeota archaeon]
MLLEIVRKFEYKSDFERLKTLKQILKSKNIKFMEQNYKYFGFSGTNIIVDMGKAKKHIILSGHFDAAPGSPGANDDASAIATLIDVIQKLKKLRLKNKVSVVFFDDEEIGRFGSISYIKEFGLKDLIVVYHLELCGYGDSIGLWPVVETNKDSYALKVIEQVLKEKNIYFEKVGQLPAFYGDDLSFREAGFSHALCISVAPKKDKEAIKRFVKGDLLNVMFDYYAGRIPRMFQLYHSPEDKSEHLSEEALKMVSDVLVSVVLKFNKENL